jgi:beta-lactamase regulating signal transducer with metallopeptidase domain
MTTLLDVALFLFDGIMYGIKFAVFIIGVLGICAAAFVLIVIYLERRERNRDGDR